MTEIGAVASQQFRLVPLSAAVGSVNATPRHLCAIAAVAKENGAENALEKAFKVRVLCGNDVR